MDYAQQRLNLIESLKFKGIDNQKVLRAMSQVPREEFIPERNKAQAYIDHALAIGSHQTISQPFIVALMTQALVANKTLNKVLEVGTGSGYQAAILANLVKQVYTVERIKNLYQHAKTVLQRLNYKNVFCHYGDGYQGLKQYAPFDGIIVTAAAEEIPQQLLTQLADGARLVIPIEVFAGQDLYVITKHGDEFTQEVIEKVIFVPMLHGTED